MFYSKKKDFRTIWQVYTYITYCGNNHTWDKACVLVDVLKVLYWIFSLLLRFVLIISYIYCVLFHMYALLFLSFSLLISISSTIFISFSISYSTLIIIFLFPIHLLVFSINFLLCLITF